MKRSLIAILISAGATTACSGGGIPQLPQTYGVQIFAEDTVTARINVAVTGDMRVSLRGDNFVIGRNRTFYVSTPATLTIERGVGTATITSVDSVSRLAVIPLGTPEDSIDVATVAGTVVKLTRLGYGNFRVAADRR